MLVVVFEQIATETSYAIFPFYLYTLHPVSASGDQILALSGYFFVILTTAD